MKTKKNFWSRWWLGIVLAAFCLVAVSSGYADIIKKGETEVLGYPGKFVEWRAGYQKSPGVSKYVHFWYDLKLKNPQQGDDVSFAICAMLNIYKNGMKIPNQPLWTMSPEAGTWKCNFEGNLTTWYPNYHFGCKQVRLYAGNSWKANPYDATVQFTEDFVQANLMAPYLDILIDCPNGFSGCDGLFGSQGEGTTNGFLIPDKFVGMTQTASYWIVTGGWPPPGPITPGQLGWSTGNWFTMGFAQNVYPSVLEGTIFNATGGATVEVIFPPSTGGGIQRYTVPGRGCLGDPLFISSPFTITEELMDDRDQNTYLRISYPRELCREYPAGEVVEFWGQTTATDFSYFPDGDVMYSPGDFMYGIHAQWAADYDPPFVVEQRLRPIDRQNYEIFVRAADRTTMAVGATLRYSVNGRRMPDFPIPYDDPAEERGNTLFRGRLGPFPVGARIEYQILLVDDAGNTN